MKLCVSGLRVKQTDRKTSESGIASVITSYLMRNIAKRNYCAACIFLFFGIVRGHARNKVSQRGCGPKTPPVWTCARWIVFIQQKAEPMTMAAQRSTK
jgi:ribosomal protein S26